MRRLLVLLSILSFLPQAGAQDKGKAEFAVNAEYRARYWWMDNAGGTNANRTNVDHRFRVGAFFRANEKLSATMSLLHNATWGAASGEAVATPDDATQADNFLAVNEAYGTWMMAEDFSLKVGRQNFQFGEGYVMGINDWEQTPYAFDGVLGMYEVELGLFQAFAFKYRDNVAVTSGAVIPMTNASDPEHSAYGVSLDFRSTPEWVKAINLHLIKDIADANFPVTGGTTVQGEQGQDVFRYGAYAALAFWAVDFKAWFASYDGENENFDVGSGALVQTDASGHMYQVELGMNFPTLWNSRLFVQYHQDSGDKPDSAGSDSTYDAYFYEQHAYAGLMDLLAWGNLTYITVGWTAKATDNTDLGLMYHVFTKSESGAGSTGATTDDAAGPTMGSNGGLLGTPTLAVEEDELGQEFDWWAEHRYEGGLTLLGRIGYFIPGSVFDKATPARRNDILQVVLQGKFTF